VKPCDLTLRDVDLDVGVITVRYTKLYKSRLVPVGPKLAQELARVMSGYGATVSFPLRGASYPCSGVSRTPAGRLGAPSMQTSPGA
jgi:integrase